MIVDLTCRQFIDLLYGWLEQEPDAMDGASMEAHLATCPDCVAYLQNYTRTTTLLRHARETPDAPLPDDVPEGLIAAVLERAGGTGRG